MNIMERDQGEARLHYLDGEYEVVTPGSFVVCAVTGAHIPLDALQREQTRAVGLQIVQMRNDNDVDPRLHQEAGDNILLKLPLGGIGALALRDDDGDAFHAERARAGG